MFRDLHVRDLLKAKVNSNLLKRYGLRGVLCVLPHSWLCRESQGSLGSFGMDELLSPSTLPRLLLAPSSS